MAVYTQLSDQDIRSFLASYPVGGFESAQGIAEGIENTNYLVVAAGVRYILTVFEKRVAAKDLPFFMALTEWLAEKHIPCPRPMRTKEGGFVGEIKGKPAALVEFLEGKNNPAITPSHMRQLGELLACMHQAVEQFPLRRPNVLALSGWQKLCDDISAQADSVMPGLKALATQELEFLGAHWPQELPSGVIHADVFPDNVFFNEGRLSGIIDFYFASTDYFAYDLAIACNAWCFDESHRFVPKRLDALREGYEAIRKLSESEHAAFPILLRGAALRFLLTRAYDWLHTPKNAVVTRKDPAEYAAKLRFFQSGKL